MVKASRRRPASGKPDSRSPKLGFWLQRPSRATCEIAALVGYDFVLLDMEHGVIGPEAADELIACVRDLGLTVYSRVSRSERVPIQAALDAGADGVILPQLQDAAHAREATAFAKYPRLGTRGIGFSRTHGYAGHPPNFADSENRRTRCYAMVETPGALAEVGAIAALPTVDGIFIGPADLSLTRGRGPVQGNVADKRDWRQVALAAAAAEKAWGMPAHDADSLRFVRRYGGAFVTVSDDLSALQLGLREGLAMAGRR